MDNDVEFSKNVADYIKGLSLKELGSMNLLKIAQKFDVSESHLCMVFNRTMDSNLNSFFLRIKMLKCGLLMSQDPSLSIKEIAEISGFSDINYFNKVFKAHYGKSPTVFSPFKK